MYLQQAKGAFLLYGRKPVVVRNRRGTRLFWITIGASHVTGSHDRRTTGVRRARRILTKGPVSPLNASYHKVSTVAPSLLDCSGYLPIPGHVIGVMPAEKEAQERQRRTPFWC